MKEKSYLSLNGNIFVTFIHMELTLVSYRLWKLLHFSFFRVCASFRNFHLVKKCPLAFIADFSLRKEVLRPVTHFAIIELYRKNPKNDFL